MMADRGWPLLPSYGLTEAASQVATALPGQTDFAWMPLLPHFEARTALDGILELRGPALLDGWMVFPANGAPEWEDPKRDGWLRTGDRAGLRGRELRVLGRADDLVKIRGELVDLAALECALQACVRSGKVALHSRPDERNGATLHVVAESAAAVREAEAAIDGIFPPYARPSEVVHGTIETTALGKTVRHRALP
jgi:O-succinylbenzoic acid--CoA ligase